MAATYIWKIKSTEDGYAIECSNCKHKISAKDAIIAENDISLCPFCGKAMDMTELDYDELFRLAGGNED